MLDLQEIRDTIEQLENSPTTFDTVIKLSALYNVLEHQTGGYMGQNDHKSAYSDNVTKELSDILPHYKQYVESKRAFQLTGNNEQVVKQMENVCREISEFIFSLYSNTDGPDERFLLYNAIFSISEKIRPE